MPTLAESDRTATDRNAKHVAKLRRVEIYRASALDKLGIELNRATMHGAPRWDKTASPKAHHAWEARESLLHLIGYVAAFGERTGYTATELLELLDDAFGRECVTTSAFDAVVTFLKLYAYEGK